MADLCLEPWQMQHLKSRTHVVADRFHVRQACLLTSQGGAVTLVPAAAWQLIG
jgi:hypothetical protein